jgi:hypothetical protein
VRLPVIFHTSVDDSTAQEIVRRLLAGSASTVTPADVSSRLARHRGNLREALFELYDLHETKRVKP